MITSASNEKMKHVMALQKKASLRREEGLFLVEGPKMAGEVPEDLFLWGFVSENFAATGEGRSLTARFPLECVADSVMNRISDTQNPQGVLIAAKQPSYTMDDLLQGDKTLILVLETLQDPGNLGTILRTGEGAGITGILMNRECVDIFNPKVVRSTMGAMFRVPFVVTDDLPGSVKLLGEKGVMRCAAHLKGSVPYDEPDYRKPAAFFIGNESKGLSDELTSLADVYVRIPMLGKVESLNAAVAAAILMYEALRQRKA